MGDEKKVVDLNLDDILPNRFQPRIKFDERAMEELSGSIKEYGVIQPILVRPIGDKYEIIAGERRYKASVLAGKDTIPAIVSDFNDRDSAEIALIENIQRRDLTPIEEAVSYKKILDMGYLNQEELAEKLDRNQSTISNKLRLLNLEDEVQEALLENKISERHARSLLRIEERDSQLKMLNKIVLDRLTVRKTDEEIDKLLNGGSMTVEVPNIENKEINMDNKEASIFNMPSEPIIEEIEIFDDISMDDEIIDIENKSYTPGFLDIDNIEKTAEDINVEKPLADIDALLKNDPNYIVEDVKIDVEEPKFQQGKFFSVPVEETQTKNNGDLETINYDNFKFDIDSEPFVNNDSSRLSNEEIMLDYNFDKPLKVNSNELSVDNDITVPDYNFDEPLNANFNESTVSNDITVPDYNFDEPLNANFNESTISDDIAVPNYNFMDDVTSNNNPEIIPEPVDFKTVLNIIRECANRIEELGYFIDVDELDFENKYQVTFNIEK